jgi:hypothetical protein
LRAQPELVCGDLDRLDQRLDAIPETGPLWITCCAVLCCAVPCRAVPCPARRNVERAEIGLALA